MGKRAIPAFSLAIVASALLGLVGCGLLAPGPAPTAQLVLLVTNSTGGEPVAGSTIWLRGLATGVEYKAISTREGRAVLRVVPDRYEIKLRKPGYAGSRVVNLLVPEGERVELRVVQREVFNPAWSARPPDVELRGVEDGDAFQGPIPYRVDVQADNDVQYIYVALGKTPGSRFLTHPRYIFVETPTTGDQELDPRPFGVRGPTTFQVVVYDVNGNRTHLLRYITVIPPEGWPASPQGLRAVAVTLGKQIQFFGLEPDSELEAQAVPAGTNVYVELSWQPPPPNTNTTPGLTGYRVYRSFDGERFEPIGQTHPGQRAFIDADPRLSVGRWVYYRVTALRGGDESPPSDVARTRPLAPFDVRLIAPRDGATNVSRTPTFRWAPTREVGRYRLYGVVLWDTVLGEEAFWATPEPPDFLVNRTSWRWNEDGRFDGTPWATLQPQRLYEWEVAYAVALDDLENPTAVSVAVNRFGLEPETVPIRGIAIEATDNFSFTTGE